MELVEGVVTVGDERFPDVDAFVDALAEVGATHGATVQAFDARYVVSERHLRRALELADRERARGEAIAHDRAVEVLLYAAGRRQIVRAMEMGVGAGETPVVVLVDGDGGDDGDGEDVHGRTDDHGGADDECAADQGADGDEAGVAADVREFVRPAETLGEYDAARVREFFDVSERELAATDAGLEALVLERVALLVVER